MADEQPDAEPLTFGEIAELAARFPERDAAVRLLRTAGFPVGRIPSWQPEDAAEFFNAVSQRLGDGILRDGRALLLATAREVSPRPPGHPRSPLDPPYRQLRPGAPEVWLLQPCFGVVPYLGRDGLLHDLESWCVEEEIFSVGLVTGEGGSGKSRLAAELCTRMQERGWDAGLATSTEAVTAFVPASSTLLVIDYPEQWPGVLGAALEQWANRPEGPQVRVLLLAREATPQSHWWSELDRASHRAASLCTSLRCDLSAYTLSQPERLAHAEAALRAFGQRLGVEVSAAKIPDVTDDEFANPLLVHVAALLAVHGQRGEANPSRSVREDVLAHLLVREQSRWDRQRAAHRLDDLHEKHALRAVLVSVLTGPSAAEVADLLGALPEFAEPSLRERRGRIGYWLAELYPGEPLLASFGPDLLVEELLDAAAHDGACLYEVISAVQGHSMTGPRHRARLLTTLRLAAQRRPKVHEVLHGYLADNLFALVEQALEDQEGLLAAALDGALVYCGERADPELRLALACVQIQEKVPLYHERGAQLLSTTTQLALPLFRGLAAIDPENNLPDLIAGLNLLIHRYSRAGRDEEALALLVECVQVRRQLVDRDPERHLPQLSFELSNLAVTHLGLHHREEAFAAAEEAVAVQRMVTERGNDRGRAQLAWALQRFSTVQAERGRYESALAANTEALPVLRELAEPGADFDVTVLAESLGTRGAILVALHRCDEGLTHIGEAIELRERLARQQPDRDLAALVSELHNASHARLNLGRYEDALVSAEQAIAISRQLTAANPRRHRLTLIRNLYQLAQVHLGLARPDDAVAAAQEALGLGRRGSETDLVTSLQLLARVLTALGRYAEVLSVYEDAAALLRSLARRQPQWLVDLASALVGLSETLDILDRPDDALAAALEAVECARGLGVAAGRTLGDTQINLGDRYARLMRATEALEHTGRGIDLLRPAGPSVGLMSALAKLAERHAQLGQGDEALTVALEAVALGQAVHAHLSHGDAFAYALRVLGNIHLAFGRPEDGLGPFVQAVRLYRELGETDPGRHRSGLAAALHHLARVQTAVERHDEAVRSCREGSDMYEELADADEDRYLAAFADSLRHLKECLVNAEEDEKALPVVRRQIEVAHRLVAQHPEYRHFLAQSYLTLAQLLSVVGSPQEADRMAALAEMHQGVAVIETRHIPLSPDPAAG